MARNLFAEHSVTSVEISAAILARNTVVGAGVNRVGSSEGADVGWHDGNPVGAALGVPLG